MANEWMILKSYKIKKSTLNKYRYLRLQAERQRKLEEMRKVLEESKEKLRKEYADLYDIKSAVHNISQMTVVGTCKYSPILFPKGRNDERENKRYGRVSVAYNVKKGN